MKEIPNCILCGHSNINFIFALVRLEIVISTRIDIQIEFKEQHDANITRKIVIYKITL